MSVPKFVRPLVSEADEAKRGALLTREHPEYAAHKHPWTILIDAFEGDGGFLNGSYLWQYPRESAEDYRDRKAMARHHGYYESLVDLVVRYVFSPGIKRSSKSKEYDAFAADVDGAGTPIEDLMRRFAAMALVTGHAAVLVDKTPDEAEGPTKADEKARAICSIFTALAIPDWRFDQNVLTVVKLLEAAPATDIFEDNASDPQYLFWDSEGWARFDADGELVSADTPGLDLVPLVLLRPKPSYTSKMLGRALAPNANVFRALFNRDSEEDEVLRAQAFSLLTVSVDKDADIQQVRESLGTETGATKALVVRGVIDYKTPDQNVPKAIRESRMSLVEELFRAAHVKFKTNSNDAESGESIRLQHSELNEMLQGLARALAVAEKQIAQYWFAWQSPTPQQAETDYLAAEVQAEYADEFFVDELIVDLEAWAEALRMDLGPTMAKRMKKAAVRRLDPDIPAEELATIDAEIDAQTPEDLAPPPPPDTGDPEGAGIEAAGDVDA